MPDLPTGTVTFLFTDIEGSTRLWEQHPEAMRLALARHDALLRHAIETHGGHVFKTIGDQFCAAFATAPDAVGAALTAQRALRAEPWGEAGPLQVRMALHTGTAEQREGDYFGPPLNRVARLLDAGHGGQVLLSQTTDDLVQEDLPPAASLCDLGLHRLRDLQRSEHVFELRHADLAAGFPPLQTLDTLPNNLPQQLTSFIGRERESAEVKQFLDTTRLVTLTGVGGTGKTRLALHVAADVLEQYPDGVWLVELAPLADPALMPQAVAVVLGVQEEPGRSLTETLASFLKPKTLLLLLDNCEHLLAAGIRLADALLRACPHLRILASSREALGLAGERTYRVPSLSQPDPQRLAAGGTELVSALTQYEAVRLFLERAVFSSSGFSITAQNAPAVAQVCHRLDGIPLAIELAAARVKAMPVEKLAERLDDRFRLLTGGSRAALPRQQTLRALIDWSYDLLSDSERALLRRLSVFVGGWTLEAAEAICGDDERPTTNDQRGVARGDPVVGRSSLVVGPNDVLDLLTALVEKSLVQYEEQGAAARYRLLETVRQYSRDRLLESGNSEAVRGRHSDWYRALAEQAEPELRGEQQAEWFERLDAEHDNLRGALEWDVESEPASALRFAAALGLFWELRGYYAEGRAVLERALGRGSAAPGTLRAKALAWAGRLARVQGETERAKALLEESLALSREAGDRQGSAFALNVLGLLAFNPGGDYGTARDLCEEGLALSREIEDKWGKAFALSNLGAVALQQGDFAAAWTLCAESLAITREIGDQRGMAWSLTHLGRLAQEQRDLPGARALYEESLAINRAIGYKRGIGFSLGGLAALAQEQGDPQAWWAYRAENLAIMRELGSRGEIAMTLNGMGREAQQQDDVPTARTLFEEALALALEGGFTVPCAHALRKLAEIAVAQAEPARAARLFGAAEAVRDRPGSPDIAFEQRAHYERCVAAARASLDETLFAAAWAEGRAMTLEQAVAYALEQDAAG